MKDRSGSGAPPVDAISDLGGIEFLRAMIAGRIPPAAIGQTMNFRLVEVGPGLARFEGEPAANLLNPLGWVHGGWALTLIDSAAGCALHTELAAGLSYTTIETKVNFVRPIAADSGKISCEGKVLSRGRQIATAEARLVTAQGKLLAHGLSTLIILDPAG